MIEVLVSMSILSVGVLGLHSLLLKGFSYKKSIADRSYAMLFAENMVEKLEINRTRALSTEDYVVSESEFFSGPCKEGSYPVSCEQQFCTAGELAVYDVAQWQFQLACTLSNGKGQVSYQESSGNRMYTISVFFDSEVAGTVKTDIVTLSHQL